MVVSGSGRARISRLHAARPRRRGAPRGVVLVALQAAHVVREQPAGDERHHRRLAGEAHGQLALEQALQHDDEVADQHAGRVEQRQVREPAAHATSCGRLARAPDVLPL
jgi:hypothetical protein